MTCEDLLRALTEYVDDETVASIYRAFGDHLCGCRGCRVVIDNIRGTIRLYNAAGLYAMPEGLQDRFRAAQRARWAEKFPGAPA